jgi:antitoxin YefM
MRRVKVNTDIRPVSEFLANAAELIERVRSSSRPLVLTQRGHSTAVVLDVVEYERMIDEIEVLRDVRTALQQLQAGQAVTDCDAKAELRSRFSR